MSTSKLPGCVDGNCPNAYMHNYIDGLDTDRRIEIREACIGVAAKIIRNGHEKIWEYNPLVDDPAADGDTRVLMGQSACPQMTPDSFEVMEEI